MADAVLQTHRQGVPVMGICGGYQMLGDTIVDEVESGLGTQPGLGLLNTITALHRIKPRRRLTRQCQASCPAGWLPRRGYRYAVMKSTWGNGAAGRMLYGHDVTENGCSVADGAVTADGLAFGTYLHGLFDSDAFTRAVVNGLRARKGLTPWETTLLCGA